MSHSEARSSDMPRMGASASAGRCEVSLPRPTSVFGTQRTTRIAALMSASHPERCTVFQLSLNACQGVQYRSAMDLASVWIFKKLDVADA